MIRWALRLAPADLGALAGLRQEPGLEVLASEDELWLRGPEPSESLARALARLPAEQRYRVSEGRLVPSGARLAVADLPATGWRGLSDWLRGDPGPAALPAERPPPLALRVEAGASAPAREPTLLTTTRPLWASWARCASELRLRPLRVASDDEGRVLVRGTPLPPLPGARWVEAQGVAVPCGYGWSPPVDAATISVVLGLLPGDLALLHPEGDWERLDASCFAPATRAAARTWLAELAGPEAEGGDA